MEYNFTYNLENENDNIIIKIYDGVNQEPCIYQPHNANTGQPWSDELEASAWAESMIENMKNPPKRINPFDMSQFSEEQKRLIEQAENDSQRLERIEKMLEELLSR